MEDGKTVELSATVSPVANYAMQQNQIPLIRSCVLQNRTDTELRELELTVVSTPAFAQAFHMPVTVLPAGASVDLGALDLRLSAEYLAALTERVAGELSIRVAQGEKELAAASFPVAALAFDEWSGNAAAPELLAAFVTPNQPGVARVIRHASEILGKWTGDPSLNAYQTNDPNRAHLQVSAIYAALQTEQITYCVPPASFETDGQRVRLCADVLSQKLGTCLDLTLLFASCLEQIGLNPIVVLLTGHALVGAWMQDTTFPESVQDDPSLLTKRTAESIHQISVVETTALTAGKSISFEDAEKAAKQSIADSERFCYFVDVARTRVSGIRPLPQRISTEHGFTIEEPETPAAPTSAAQPDRFEDLPQLRDADAAIPVTKKKIWERNLLDLSLRNNLLNFRPRRACVHVLAAHMDTLEDALASGEELEILEYPQDWQNTLRSSKLFEMQNSLGPMEPLLEQEFRQKRLRSDLSGAELTKQLTLLYRRARGAMEENGANVLYLAIGFLKWFETETSQQPRYAPVVLVPVEIVRKSARRGYVLRERDDESRINVTLLELLKQMFGIQLSGLDPLPTDEHGVDLRLILHILRQAVMSQPRWDVLEEAYLGIFWFTRFVMWNDLRTRSDELAKNKIVRSLMAGGQPFEQSSLLPEGEPDGYCDPKNVLLGTDADASQLGAVYAAAQGKSFVLHGPPGTGKSQTITNMICNALVQGKSVLFVAEKMAALSVVQQRLEQIGLGPFCLELHSNKAVKKAVLDQLHTAMEVTRTQPPAQFAEEAEHLRGQREALNEYMQALYRPYPFGATFYEALVRYSALSSAPDALTIESPVLEKMDGLQAKAWMDLAAALRAAGSAAGHPHNHPLQGILLKDFSPALKLQAGELLRACTGQAETVLRLADACVEVLGIDAPVAQEEHRALAGLDGVVQTLAALPAALAENGDVRAAVCALREAAPHGEAEQGLRRKLLPAFSPDVLGVDARAMQSEWNTLEGQWFLPKLLGQGRLYKTLRAFAPGGALSKEGMPALLSDLVKRQKEETTCKQAAGSATSLLGDVWRNADTDWRQVLDACTQAEEAERRVAAVANDPQAALELRRRLAKPSARQASEKLHAYHQALDAVTLSMQKLTELLRADFAPGSADEPWLASAARQCENWAAHLDGLRDWCVWNRTRAQAIEQGLSPLAEAYEAGSLQNEDVQNAFQKAFYRACMLYILGHENALSGFSGPLFEEQVRRFGETTEHLRALTKQETVARLSANIPDFSGNSPQSSETGILKRAIRSNGRGLSIRSLFTQIPRLLPRLCPCMLMSPISVAQYLDPAMKPFDLVIFDEASQVPTSEAVGALARGENAVIVGDPKQMPPTSFFTSSAPDDDETIEQQDLESILEDCLAVSVPEMHLSWHYRSRHESLIAFSNIRYYDNGLRTFPSPTNLASCVTLVPVDGFYDRGDTKQNAAEAQAVVEDILRRLNDPALAQKSIGVVTFNSAQQNLIDDLLTEAFAKNPDLEETAKQCHEPIFIKNLENVQGDERDVILFSICYGPDKIGRVAHNFGPLNQAGGWRRLNVAVSRAREEMTVYSTLRPELLDLSRTHAEGVAGLKAFLSFAQNGPQSLAYLQSETNDADRSLSEQIATRLRACGYQVQTHIGSSKYKIDAAIVHPRKKDTFLLGILCNGESYRAARMASDRELLQRGMLKRLGWSLCTVWALDWLNAPEKEIQKICALAQSLLEQPEAAPPATPEKPVRAAASIRAAAAVMPMAVETQASPAPAPKTDRDERKQPYRLAQLPQTNLSSEAVCEPQSSRFLLERITSIIETEGPVSRSLLGRRLMASVGIARIGSRLDKRLSDLLKHVPCHTQKHGNETFYWPSAANPLTYRFFRVPQSDAERRNAEDLPPEEVANAACFILENDLSMHQTDLLRETYKLFGFARGGSALEQAMNAGIRLALKDERITLDEAGIVSFTQTDQ